MAYVTLAQAKKHLNIDESFTDDDAYISTLIEVAVDSAEKHVDIEFKKEFGEDSLPTPIYQAILLHIGTLYANRESVAEKAMSKVEHTYEYLLSLYKVYSVG